MDAICDIESRSFFDPYPRSLVETLLRENPGTFLVAEVQQGIVVGYCAASQKRTYAHLISIGVLPEFRRRGIGAALIQVLVSSLDSYVTQLRLEVKQGNAEALTLYERLGFLNVGMIDGYYADGSRAVKMQLTLTRTGPTVHLQERRRSR